MDLLTTYVQDQQLQVIITLFLISTLQITKIYNTGTITVSLHHTLQISLYYSRVYNSQLNSQSQSRSYSTTGGLRQSVRLGAKAL
jgi:hypothetical protein